MVSVRIKLMILSNVLHKRDMAMPPPRRCSQVAPRCYAFASPTARWMPELGKEQATRAALTPNGSKRRSVKASNRVSRLITRPGLVTNILSTANSPRVKGSGLQTRGPAGKRQN
jgi:hypothetical protein